MHNTADRGSRRAEAGERFSPDPDRFGPRPSSRKRRRTAILAAGALLAGTALAGCGGGSGPPVLTWYINPDNGTQQKLAQTCTEQANGRYRIQTALLPRDSTAQREQLVRRLAAGDQGVDLMSLDVPYLAEFANAGFVRRFSADERARLTKGMLTGPLDAAQWKGALYAVPFNTNTQLLWYHKSVARKAGLDVGPTTDVTWDQVIKAAEKTGTTVQVQASRYEGYSVLINSLVASAGGRILKNPQAGKEVTPSIDSKAGRAAANVLRTLARSKAASPDISNSDEGTTQAGFLEKSGGFMTNWPFVYTAETGILDGLKQERQAAKSAATRADLDQKIKDQEARIADFGWARWPAVVKGRPSAPPLGGIDLAIGAFTRYPAASVEAVACLTSPASQKTYMLGEGLLPTVESVYADPKIRKAFPMSDLLRRSVDEAAPRPVTPYYPDITAAIQRTWHPPGALTSRTPAETAQLIVAVLHDRELI
ncbi:extracellular solute-binding protein [Actinopolymorpha alba]|uniref:extracellular solute-binding protein n=1 Tax=Actinopolymorpha alba TaxID=533267 RepID=UPI0003604981|nr:extracellular solute-binding protein [Actinopolymorpha alba]